MRVIYTSKGMSKSLGCALYIRCALSIEKYGNSKFSVANSPLSASENTLLLPVYQTFILLYVYIFDKTNA